MGCECRLLTLSNAIVLPLSSDCLVIQCTFVVWLSLGDWLSFTKPFIHPVPIRAAPYFVSTLDHALPTPIYSHLAEICIKYSYL